MQNYATSFKMANYFKKLYLIFLFIYLINGQSAYCQQNKIALTQADKLFRNQKYPESFQIYEDILKNGQEYSPQMLVKMAYIQENLKNYTASIYYLHLYYAKIPSRKVLLKIEELAQQHGFSGYEYSDTQFFRTQLTKYYEVLLQLMLMIAVVSVTILFINWRRKRLPSPAYQAGFVLFLLFIFYYINFLNFGKQAIIGQSQSALMSAPTAGASWLATVSAGHKINLTGETDIWYETEWQGKTAYIRKNNVWELP